MFSDGVADSRSRAKICTARLVSVIILLAAKTPESDEPSSTDMRKKTKVASPGGSDKYEMLIDERRQHILELVQRQGRVLVTDLSSELEISQITIRKDLDWLQSQGLIQRSHGGALRIPSSALADPTLQEKEKHHHLEKQKIAAAAVKMVEEGQCVILDSGTTTTAIAHGLKRFSRLTVITNAVNIAAEL